MENEEKRAYLAIGLLRGLDIKVFFDGTLVYDGMVENAPGDVKRLVYSKITNEGGKMAFWAYSEINQ